MRHTQPNGFIILEVLVAMGLILGVWLTSMGAYQTIVMRLIAQEARRVELRKAFDAYEIQEQPSVNFSNKDMSYESSRVSDRNRSVHHSVRPIAAGKRTTSTKTN